MGRKRKIEEEEESLKVEEESPVESKSTSSKSQGKSKKKKSSKELQRVEIGESPSSARATSAASAPSATSATKSSPKSLASKSPSKKSVSSPLSVKSKGKAPLPEEHDSEVEEEVEVPEDLDSGILPPVEILNKLLDRMENHLPKEDRVKYDSQVRKLDWDKIAFEGLSGSQCQSTWMHIQERIRRFRVLSEMIPDAREWISHPWTNFYKSRTFNRHPDMPKKPLSVYMFYYSQQMNKILKKNPELTMPEVAKICSEQYAQLSDEKKQKYKTKCDEMKTEYNRKMEEFYSVHPDMVPSVKGKGKSKASPPNAPLPETLAPLPLVQHPPQLPPLTTTYVMAAPTPSMLAIPTAQMHQPHQPQVVPAPTPNNNNNIVYDPKYLPKVEKVGQGAPERPFKPFDLYFKREMETCSSDPAFDRQAFAQKCRKEWKEMKNKKKAKWIKGAYENYRKYEAELKDFIALNPGYVPPSNSHKNFLTIEDQKILDRSMGRPEKPSSSAYSLFSKEMLNNEDIKEYPSKERMSHISDLWKTLPDEKKESYQSEVNEAMGIYRQKYEDWFNGLNEEERKAESDRNNSKSNRKTAAKAAAAAAANNPNPSVLPNGQQILQIRQGQFIYTAPPGQAQPTPVIMQQPQVPPQTLALLPTEPLDPVEELKKEILTREPIEPARSRKQLFLSEWLPANKKKKPADAMKLWRSMDKSEKSKWKRKLEPQRQKYIEDYTLFVRGLSKQELELYMDLKQKRDEEEEAKKAEMSDSEDSSESEESEEEDNDSD